MGLPRGVRCGTTCMLRVGRHVAILITAVSTNHQSIRDSSYERDWRPSMGVVEVFWRSAFAHAQTGGSARRNTGCRNSVHRRPTTPLPHHSLTAMTGRDRRATARSPYSRSSWSCRETSLTIAPITMIDKEHPRQRRDRTALVVPQLEPGLFITRPQIALVACSQAGFRTENGLFS